ncbi:MAG: putative sulfate exporter family transporter [Chloroflexi bacterium]|nr:putative sulfate exporter family transporter [Chloroflexota bacterium]
MVALAAVSLALARVEEAAFGQALIEALVLALLLGVLARNVAPAGAVQRLNPGAGYAAKQVLELGVALLGAGVSFPEILRAGPALLTLVIGGVSACLLVGYLAGRGLGLQVKLSVLVAVGNAICGNSAIAAVAPVIRAEKKDVASAIGLTAVIGVCLVLGLPLLIVPLGLSNYQYGVLAGMSVYAVPQVVAAAFPVSQLSGDVATLVKLTRVLLLGPVVVLMGLLFRGEGGVARKGVSAYLPWFVAAFLLLAAARSLGLLPDALATPARDVSRLLTILAMAGLGFGVELAAVRMVGLRVGVAVIATLAFLATFTVVLIRVLGIQG